MTTPATSTDPTRDQWAAYTRAFDYFNAELFDDELPHCILNFSRHARFQGFFAPLRWERPDGRTHEISLNPRCLKRPPRETMGTLVHEMVHLWQQEFGKPSRPGYHNREFAAKMESVGLITSKTGKPGGKRTGQGMSHYIVEEGPFDLAFAAMPQEYLLPWTSGAPAEAAGPAPKAKNKIKYTCPGCATNAWGKPELSIICGVCGATFTSEGSPPAKPEVIAIPPGPQAAARSLADFFQGDDVWLFFETYQGETGVTDVTTDMVHPYMEPVEMADALQEWPEDCAERLAEALAALAMRES
jgi:hypothetical protein